ncbi:MAG: DUF5606 domain-containing protein [Bacteroidetes bacterium]|jgi:hypothetical protein|nr:DUF5606 domain-containing protein [Bacteroidota bacterium]
MDLSGIISIAGMSGLYRVVAQTKNGLIVESLVDKKRVPAYSTNRVSALEDVSIYSTGDDVPLKEVFQKIFDKEKGAACIDHKSADAELRKYFKSVFAEYDEDRVYTSDIKKVLMWYNSLQKEGLLDKKEETKAEDKPKVKATATETKLKNTVSKVKESKTVKTASAKVKTQGVRKTGAA